MGRRRGRIEPLKSGALRVRVSNGLDPVSKKRLYLDEVIPAGTPHQAKAAEQALTRLLNRVDEQRVPRTRASIAKMLDDFMEVADLASGTRRGWKNKIKNHIKPLVGNVTLDSRELTKKLDGMFATLRRCRKHCDGEGFIEHRTHRVHQCDGRCRIHECAPLGGSMQQEIHTILNQAFERAVAVWGWLPLNPMQNVRRPTAPPPEPKPPTTPQAARIVMEAFRVLRWGVLVWLAMTSGARRGELCALRRSDLNEDGTLQINKAVKQDGSQITEGPTKTHQHRRVVLDSETIGLLRALMAWADQQAAAVGLALDEDCYLFSPTADGREPLHPDTVTSHFSALARRLGIACTFHKLRHYSATELILAGVDIRTVAGRLGHSGGGATTLRVYTAWVSEADQRAADTLAPRMPVRVDEALAGPSARAKINPQNPYEVVAVAVFKKIMAGELPAGTTLPTQKELCLQHQISAGTAARVFDLLKEWGAIEVTKGRRAIVASGIPGQREQTIATASTSPAEPATITDTDIQLVYLTARVAEQVVHELLLDVDLSSPRSVRSAVHAFAQTMSPWQREAVSRERCVVEVEDFDRQNVLMKTLLPRLGPADTAAI